MAHTSEEHETNMAAEIAERRLKNIETKLEDYYQAMCEVIKRTRSIQESTVEHLQRRCTMLERRVNELDQRKAPYDHLEPIEDKLETLETTLLLHVEHTHS